MKDVSTTTLTHKVYSELAKIPTDKDGWITYTKDVKAQVSNALGLTEQQVMTTISNLLKGKSIEIVKEKNLILGVKVTGKVPAVTILDAAKASAAERAARVAAGLTTYKKRKKQPETQMPVKQEAAQTVEVPVAPPIPLSLKNGHANSPEYYPENLSYTRATIMTPETDRYEQARQFADEAIKSPYLRIEFTENELAEESLALKKALARAENLLTERTQLLNVITRERNYLKKIQNPTLRSALQNAGVLVKHGD